jgi:3'-phosphoadenosine 5'-phosphosulfate sulfotransferase (PAPS reductase)/FAD synthetase
MEGVVMFSGGVESVALLNWLKKRNENVVALHSIFPNPESQANKLRENVVEICNLLKTPLIIHEHPTYSPNPYFGESEDYFHSSKHWILACCTAALKYPQVKKFYWGVNSGILEYGDGGDYHFLPRAWEFQIAFEFFGRIMNGLDHDQKMYPPLSGWTKKKMWESIPDNIKPLVVSCSYPTDDLQPCNVCYKCKEYQSMSHKHIYTEGL